MDIQQNKKRVLDLTVDITLNAIRRFAENRKDPNFQILDTLMPKERKIRSIVGGLETSLGTTLWEPLAEGLARMNGFEVLNGKGILKPVNAPATIEKTMNEVISNRESKGSQFDERKSREAIKKACAPLVNKPIEKFIKPPSGKGVDVWLRKDGIDYLLDSKTVQPNVGDYKDCLRQLMTWYVYYYSKYPEGNARAMIFIPYNPYAPEDFFKKTKGHGFPLLKEELWVQDDLWDFCTGVPNAFEIILSAFKHISDRGLVTIELDKLFKEK